MRVARLVFSLCGLAALAWGILLTVQFASSSFVNGRAAVAFLLGGPVLHDAVIAPLVGLTGLLIARLAGPAWRAPILIGAAVSAVLALVAVPALWRTYAGVPNPGLADRPYGTGLLIALAVVWAVALAAGLVRCGWGRRRGAGAAAPRRRRR